MPVSFLKADANVRNIGAGGDLRGFALIENPSFMQQDCIVAWLDLINEMSCPKHPNACPRDKAPDMLKNIRAGFDIQSNRRLVEQKHARAM